LKPKFSYSPVRKLRITGAACAVFAWMLLPNAARGQAPPAGSLPNPTPVTFRPPKITIEEAVQLAIQHNHNLLAARTTILQNQALEVQANLRPNPTLFTDWEYLPLPGVGVNGGLPGYLQASTEADLGMSYLFERGQKRQNRLKAAKDATAVTRATVADNERTLGFAVAQLFYNAQLAEATLELANTDLASFQNTVEISEYQYKIGGLDMNDYLQIKVQMAQFQTAAEMAVLARNQALSDLRQLLGYESVPAEYDVTGAFEYQPLTAKIEDLQMKALENRPDFRAAQLSITAAQSQYGLQKAEGKQDVTASGNYSHVNGLNAATWSLSVPLAIFNRNQGNIEQAKIAITQAQQQELQAQGQVLTDVKDAYVGVESNGRVAKLYVTGVLDDAKTSRDISEYSYHRGATPLLAFLVAQRNYDAIALAYRQAVAAYLTSIEQLRQAVGSRSL
jgi:cobalt-zinc-cadmium efflux system outer membrane protein